MKEPHESSIDNAKASDKIFDNYTYMDIDVKEAIGTTFLGVLVIMLLTALLRCQQRYADLLRQRESGG